MKIAAARDNADFWAGVMFVAFGVLALYLSRDYPAGSAMRMGPGYFPRVLGMLMIVLGAIVAARGLAQPGERIGPWAARPLLTLGAGIVAFGFAIEPLGFVPALIILLLFSAFAGREFRIVEVILLVALLVSGAVGIFIYGIGLPYRLFWWS